MTVTREGDYNEAVVTTRCDRRWQGQQCSTIETSGTWVWEKKIEEERTRSAALAGGGTARGEVTGDGGQERG